MNNQQLYEHCRETVAQVTGLGDREAVYAKLGAPVQALPTDGFFVTHADLSVTHCDAVELFHFDGCAIRIGYIKGKVAKVRGMPLEHWLPPGNA